MKTTPQSEARLRRAILDMLQAARPQQIPGAWILDGLQALPDGCGDGLEPPIDESQVLALCQDLVELQFARAEDGRTLTAQRYSLATTRYGITPAGTALVEGLSPRHVMVADQRIR